MIYIIKVKSNDDGTYIVKIGHSTKGIKDRYQECKQKHKNILLPKDFYILNFKKEIIYEREKQDLLRLNPNFDDIDIINHIGLKNEGELYV